MITQNENQTSSRSLTTQNHDFRSLWNYFFDLNDTGLTHLQPKIDITENKNAVCVTAEIPGIKEEKLDLEISEDGYLVISGEKEQKSEKEGKNSYFSEISYGMFKRAVPLPFDLEYDMAEADYENGVLSITIPKSKVEKQKFKKINLKKTMHS